MLHLTQKFFRRVRQKSASLANAFLGFPFEFPGPEVAILVIAVGLLAGVITCSDPTEPEVIAPGITVDTTVVEDRKATAVLITAYTEDETLPLPRLIWELVATLDCPGTYPEGGEPRKIQLEGVEQDAQVNILVGWSWEVTFRLVAVDANDNATSAVFVLPQRQCVFN